MKTFDGYKKQALTDVYALLAGGGHKPLSEFSMAHTHPYLPLIGGTVTGNIILKGGTSSDMTYVGNVHPYIRFDNSDSSQNISLIFTDYDSYRRPAGIKLIGNQGNEWFEAANIYATTFYGALSGNSSTATKLQTPRTIWGQSFDGTGNVDNTLRIRQTTGNYCEGIRIQTADGAWSTIILGATADNGTNTNAWSIHRKADNNFAISRNSSDGLNGLVMTSVGMGLGTTAPTHRLDVRGDTKITGSIRDLAIGGGIYWNPYVESTTDNSDAASITVVKSGIAGGTTLVLRQMNDANDTIQFQTSTAAKLYHNSYPILTTQNTYVSNNKGYINGTEITQVNNADMLDGYHLSTLVNKSGENLITGTTHASTIGWNQNGWSGGISTYDENNGVYKIWSTGGWHTLYYTLNSQYASKSISFSFDIMFISSESTEGPVTVNVGASNSWFSGTNYSPSTSGSWEHKQGTFTLGSTPYFGIIIHGTDNSGKSCFYLIKNLKVELGDLPTIWTPAHADITWNNLTGKPSSFIPSAHTHPYLPLSGGTLTGALTIDFNHSGGGTTSSLLNVLFNGTHDYGIVAKFHSYGGDSPAIRFSHSSNKSEYNSQVNTNWSVGMRSNTYTDFAITQNRGTSGWGTVRFAINNSGNVGIGIDSASYKLHVAGDIYTTTGFKKNGSSDSYVLLGGGGHKSISDFATSGHTHSIYAANENYGGFTKSGRLPISGFYQSCESESSGNAPWTSWMHLINCQHSNGGNNYALQIAASFYNNNTFKIRVTNGDVNNTWRDIIHSGNIGNQTVANAYHLRINSANTWSTWHWSGQSGQPSWLWGSNDGTNMYVWNPSNFRVAYAASAGNADTVDGYHASAFATSGHTHDDRYYTKTESNAKYITDITTSVNKLTFTRNGSNITKDITVNVVYSQGNLTNISNEDNTTKASSGLFIYNSYSQVIGTNNYSSVLSINTGGTIQIAGNWGDDQTRNLYWRSQSDRAVSSYPWKSWRTILDSENYSSILDSRYYTESEVNNLLSNKLNISNFNWTNLPGKLVAGNEFNIVNAGFNNRMWFNYVPINDRSKTATILDYGFGNGHQGYATVTASGFVKNGSSSSYVLLGDGGHKDENALNVSNADTVDGEHASNFSYTHQTSFDFSKSKSSRIVTFDESNTEYGWINGFASTHNNYLTSIIFNTHRTSNWYVGYIEASNGVTKGLSAVKQLAFLDSKVADSDKLDGIHANGLLTALSNSNNGISITVGGTTKSISNISVNYASSAGNADTVDGYHASALWRSNGATWNPDTNVSLTASANNQEWSFDIRRNGYTGCYWHVWDSALSTLLKVNADNGKVYAPYNFVGNLEGNASSASTATKLASSGYANNALSYYQTDQAFDGSATGWAHYIIANHGNGASYYHYTIRLPFQDVPQYRRQTGSTSNVTSWYNFITAENIGSQSVNYATSAGNADTLDGQHANAFAATSHSHPYLPLSGGTMIGQIVGNNKGGPWIQGRSNAVIYQPRNVRDDWHPVVGFKTKTGSWEFGNVGNDDFATFSWESDSNYSSGTNTNTKVNLRNSSGTIALTSDIPTKSSWNYDDVYSKLGHTHDDRYYTESEINSKLRSYLPLSGGTMTGNITYTGKGTSYIGNGANDAANGVGGTLNNLVISSWQGVSFTTSCSGQTYTNKNAVSINCRNGYVYANTFVGTFSGNASSATSASKWTTARTLTLTGSVTGSVSIDGSANVTLTTTTNHTHNWANIEGKPNTFTPSSHTHDDRYYTESEVNTKLGTYLPLSGGTMTGTIKYGEKSYEIIRTGGDNTTYRSGLKYSWSGNTTIALWGKNSSTQFVWHAGTDFSSVDVNGTTTRTYDFQVGRVNGTLEALIGGNKIWHAGNDGSGSGLDADKLDGYHASSFALSGHTHTLKLESSTKNSSINLIHGGKYELTAGGSSIIFTLPTSNNVDPTNYYWANVKVSATSSTSTIPTFSKVMINTTSSSYQLNVGGDSYSTGWFRSNNGLYCEDTGVHFTHHSTYTSAGEIDMTSTNEFCWGSNSSILYFNYRAASRGTTVTSYVWNAGSSNSYASHTTGHITLGNSGYQIKRVGCNVSWANGRLGAIVRQTSANGYSVVVSSKTVNGSWEIGNYTSNGNSLYFTYISDSNYNSGNNAFSGQVYFDSNGSVHASYLRASNNVEASGSMYATHFYENSDIRYKKILKNLSINSNTIATLPLFDFEWIENNAIGTGTSAQAVQQILPNLVFGTDKLTLDYGVLGTIAGITACKELVTQKSELQQLKEKVKQLEDKLRKYENI